MQVRFTLSLARPSLHLIGVEMLVEDAPEGTVRVRAPEWIPGHYGLMNNARFVQDIRALVGDDEVPIRKTDKQTWEVEKADARRFVLRYDVYARTLSSSACFFDDTQCHVNGGNLFLYVEGHQDAPCSVAFRDVPRGWQVATGLESDGASRWTAPTYDDLIDSPIKIGVFHERTFRVRGKLHTIAISDLGDTIERLPRYVKDVKAFVTWLADLFGGLPYEHYVFLCDYHPTRCKGGALEHKNSTHLALPLRLDSDDEDDYLRILAVTCHEYFHLWNVKRIRPRGLGPFDYTREAHTPDLWVAEGLTDYYAWYALVRSGSIGAKTYATWLCRYVDDLNDMPGQGTMSLKEASWETWTQAFWQARHSPEETNAPNRYVNYYTKGALVGALLDVEMRAATGGQKGLDDVFRALWKRADEPEGFEPGAVEAEVERIAGTPVRRKLEAWVGKAAPLPYRAVFRKAGLAFTEEVPAKEEDRAKRRRKILGAWGIEVDDKGPYPTVVNVVPDGAGARAGLNRGDVLLALDGRRLTGEEWRRILEGAKPGVPVPLAFFRYDRLREIEVVPDKNARKVARLEAPASVPDAQKKVRDAWLGKTEPFRTGPEKARAPKAKAAKSGAAAKPRSRKG
jgi:predicted metalloprotease with PDZ domain